MRYKPLGKITHPGWLMLWVPNHFISAEDHRSRDARPGEQEQWISETLLLEEPVAVILATLVGIKLREVLSPCLQASNYRPNCLLQEALSLGVISAYSKLHCPSLCWRTALAGTSCGSRKRLLRCTDKSASCSQPWE